MSIEFSIGIDAVLVEEAEYPRQVVDEFIVEWLGVDPGRVIEVHAGKKLAGVQDDPVEA